MLPAQVSYWQLQETKRHNEAMESLTGKEIDEKVRHNLQDERVRVGTLAETQRNNLYVNRQGDFSLGLNAIDTATRRFSAVKQAEIGETQAQASMIQAGAAQRQADAAMINAGTNQAIGQSTIALNTARAEQASAQATTETYKQENLSAQTENTQKETSLADFYAGDRARQTRNQTINTYTNVFGTAASAYNDASRNAVNLFGNVLNNVTPWN